MVTHNATWSCGYDCWRWKKIIFPATSKITCQKVKSNHSDISTRPRLWLNWLDIVGGEGLHLYISYWQFWYKTQVANLLEELLIILFLGSLVAQNKNLWSDFWHHVYLQKYRQWNYNLSTIELKWQYHEKYAWYQKSDRKFFILYHCRSQR